jgi:predicted nucleotidyltransferase
MAEHIADCLDAKRFGVRALYVFGSTKNGTAGPNSDLDLLIHFQGDTRQREDLMLWLEGWSLALAEVNYLRTGYRTSGLIDLHVVTDEDIARQDSFAIKINAVTDPARELPLGGALPH